MRLRLGLRTLEVGHRTSDANVFTALMVWLRHLVGHVLRLRRGMGMRRLVGHRGGHKVAKISIPLNVELLSGGQVRQVEAVSI